MANPMFEKLIAKKKAEGKDMSPAHEKAKGTVLSDLMDHLEGMGMDKVKGLKKVTVASDSKEGLAKGLDKAKEIATQAPDSEEGSEDESAEGSDAEEASESPAMEASEGEEGEAEEEKSPEEMKSEIEELKAELAKHKSMSMGRI